MKTRFQKSFQGSRKFPHPESCTQRNGNWLIAANSLNCCIAGCWMLYSVIKKCEHAWCYIKTHKCTLKNVAELYMSFFFFFLLLFSKHSVFFICLITNKFWWNPTACVLWKFKLYYNDPVNKKIGRAVPDTKATSKCVGPTVHEWLIAECRCSVILYWS